MPTYVKPGEDNFVLRPSWSQGRDVEPTAMVFVVHSAPKFFDQR